MIGLSVLIPTTPDRINFIERLIDQFEDQLKHTGSKFIRMHNGGFDFLYYEYIDHNKKIGCEVEVVIFEDETKQSIGFKRNMLMREANGAYLGFIDSDDRIGPNYFKHAFTGIEKDVDVCGLTGIITEDGKNPKKFVHSMKYDSWYEKDGVYYRNNNHLNVVKTSIARQMKFPEINSGEDHDYSKQLLASGLIKTEYWDENEIIYYYDFRNNK